MATNTEADVTLQSVIDSHINAKKQIYNDVQNPDNTNISNALSSLLTSPNIDITAENDEQYIPMELKSLMNTTLAELSPLARKAKYIEIQENFAKYYQQTNTSNQQVLDVYDKAIDKVNSELLKQQSDLKDLKSELAAAKRGESTNYRQTTISKYNLNKASYYRSLYMVYTVVLTLTLVLIYMLGRPVLGILGRASCILALTMALIFLAIFTIYYVYFKHPVRDNFAWNKHKWSSDNPSGATCNGGVSSQTNAPDNVEQRAAALARSSMS